MVFLFGTVIQMIKNDIAASIAKAAPPTGANLWIWLGSHDINWWVAVATIGYIGLQAYYLIKSKGRRGGRVEL
ncbi:hypothetical protein P3T40_002007 [Paraburkholderia sp. EB58]